MNGREMWHWSGLGVVNRRYKKRTPGLLKKDLHLSSGTPIQGPPILMVLIIILLMTPAVSAQGGQGSERPVQATDARSPWLTNTSSSSSTIHWKTEQLLTGTIEYISIKDLLQGNDEFLPVSEMMPAQLHTVSLSGLMPGTEYQYRIKGQPGNYSFSTYPESGTVRFVVYGDTRNQEGWKNQDLLQTTVARGIATEEDILFVIHTGDIVYDPANRSEWEGFFEKSGAYLPNVTFCPVPGNHEASSAEYAEIFGLPDDYSFQCGDITVICIDSNPMNKTRGDAQRAWLVDRLHETKNLVFVAMHHPLYSSDEKHPGGYTDQRLRYEPLFIQSGTGAVFSAHVHAYEHFESGGIQYFTVATGGAPFYPLLDEKPAGHIFSLENTAGYAVVTVNETAATLEFIRVAEERDGVVRLFPPGDVAERVVIKKKAERWPVMFQGLPDLLKSPVYVFNVHITGLTELFSSNLT